MLSKIKSVVRKILHRFGYQLNPRPDKLVPYLTFYNLCKAYEQLLSDSGDRIPENDRRFELMSRLKGTPPPEAYFIVQALTATKNVSGDICEFGVAQGITSALIANEILDTENIYHLFDSFEGLPQPSEKDILKDDVLALGSMNAYKGTMSFPENLVQARLDEVNFPRNRRRIHKGFIDQVLADGKELPTSVAFAFVDFDFYDPIKDTLEFLADRMLEGAIVIVDDYDYFSTGAKTAVDEFLTQQNISSTRWRLTVPNENFGKFAVLVKC
jgi:hypothetical protein